MTEFACSGEATVPFLFEVSSSETIQLSSQGSIELLIESRANP